MIAPRLLPEPPKASARPRRSSHTAHHRLAARRVWLRRPHHLTDDLDMGAILNHYGLEETLRLAIEAGNDLAMICHRIANVEEAHAILGRAARARKSTAPSIPFRASKVGSRRPMSFPRRNSGAAMPGCWICASPCSAPRPPRTAALRTENARLWRFIDASRGGKFSSFELRIYLTAFMQTPPPPLPICWPRKHPAHPLVDPSPG